VLVALERGELHVDVELGRAGADRRAHRTAVAGSGDDHAEQQPVVGDDLLDVAELDVVLGEDVEQRRRDPRPVAAGDGEEQAHEMPSKPCAVGVVGRHARPPDEPGELAQRLLAAGRLVGVDAPPEVLRGQLHDPRRAGGRAPAGRGPARVAAGQLVLVDAAAGLRAQVLQAPATSGRQRATSRSRSACAHSTTPRRRSCSASCRNGPGVRAGHDDVVRRPGHRGDRAVERASRAR
jgi:hypothetical protein